MSSSTSNTAELEESLSAARTRLAALNASDDEDARDERASCLARIGGALTQLGRYDEAAEPLDEAELLLAQIPYRTLTLAAVRSWKAHAARERGDLEQALSLFEQIDLAEMTQPGLASLKARVVIHKMQLLGRLERVPECLDAARSALVDFAEVSTPDGQEVRAAAYAHQAVSCWWLGDFDLALDAADHAIASRTETYQQTRDPADRQFVAKHMMLRANILDARGERTAASKAFLDFIDYSRDIQDATVRRDVRRARMRRFGIRVHAPYVPGHGWPDGWPTKND